MPSSARDLSSRAPTLLGVPVEVTLASSAFLRTPAASSRAACALGMASPDTRTDRESTGARSPARMRRAVGRIGLEQFDETRTHRSRASMSRVRSTNCEKLAAGNCDRAAVEARRSRATYAVSSRCAVGASTASSLRTSVAARQRGAFGQLDVDHELEARRVREELLFDEAEAHDGQHEQADGGADHDPAVRQRPIDQRAEAAVERLLVRIAVAAIGVGARAVPIGQQSIAEIRDEHDRHDPRDEQRDRDDLEIERVYSPVPDAAGAIGRKPRGGDQRTVSIGNAVLRYANAAAATRSSPSSSFTAIISTAMTRRRRAAPAPPRARRASLVQAISR